MIDYAWWEVNDFECPQCGNNTLYLTIQGTSTDDDKASLFLNCGNKNCGMLSCINIRDAVRKIWDLEYIDNPSRRFAYNG